MWVQLLPPSSDLYTPSPHETLRQFQVSPAPSQTTAGLEGATATDPSDAVPPLLKIGSQVTPRLMLFQAPPVAVAT
jgi:hypothetical protein